MEKIKKIFNQKTRNILSIIIIILGVAFLINYIFYTPSYINAYIATNIYKEPANKYFDDDNFYKCVVDAYNKENNTSIPYTQNLSDSQLGSIKNVNCSGINKSDNAQVKSAKGVEKLTALTDLDVRYNKLTTLDVSNNTNLIFLRVYWNSLTKLDVSKNTKLTELDVKWNRLTALDVSNNTNLTELSAVGNQLTKLDVSKNTKLTELSAGSNQLTTLEVSNNANLTKLNVCTNQLTTLDVGKNTALTGLYIENNKLITLDVSKNTNLKILYAGENQLTTLGVSKNTKLTELDVHNNKLTTLDVSNNTNLTELYVYNNQLTTLDVSKNTNLKILYAGENQLTTLGVSNNTNLTELWVYDNQLTTLDVSKNTNLKILSAGSNQLTTLDVSKNAVLTELNVCNNRLTTLDVSNNTNLTKLDVGKNKLLTIYTKLNDTFSINKGLILPDGWNIKVLNDNKESLSFDDNNGKGLKVGEYVVSFEIYNSQGKKIYYDEKEEFNVYVYNILSDTYTIDKDNIYIGNDDSNDVIINNIKIDGGNVDGYTKSIDNNKLVIKYNDKIIKEYNLVKIGIKSKHYSINGDNIVYVNDFDINEINLNYGSKEVKDNKLVIKYNDKVIKEYKLYGIKTKYSVINNTIYVGEIINTEDELRECINNCSSATDQVGCADDCEMRYNILDHITSSDLKLSIDNDKLICKYNNEIINEFVLSSESEYDIIDDYTKENDIISRIPIDTDMNVFKTKINTNIGYIFKDSKNNDIVTNRKLRTGDKVIFNYSSGDIDYVLSVIGDVNSDGIINGKDIIEISNDIVGNKKLDNLGSLSGDIDNNGKMDIRDIIKMCNYIKKGKF